MNLEDQLAVALDIAERAGDILKSYFDIDRMAARSKGLRDVLTDADLASERYVVDRLRKAFPADGIVGEEGSDIRQHAGRRWYVDPLDGTLNYSRGIPIWSFSLALFDGGQPLLGVVHDPVRNETFSAYRGAGAWLNTQPIHCSEVSEASSAVVHLTIDFNDESRLEGLEDVQILAPKVLRTRSMGSAALALAYTAAGRFDGMLHRSAHTWDYAAGALLVEEAGGCLSDLEGKPFGEQTVSMAAAGRGELHQALLDLLRRSQDM